MRLNGLSLKLICWNRVKNNVRLERVIMGKILELPIHIANQIKAGEIVERPVSVVKELVENAIDANSRQIDVVIEGGGLSKIQVIDNGDGIASDDTLIAFKRHATSKMTALVEQATLLTPDKMPIKTLGFRGEALASIASVAKVTLQTATRDTDGTYVYLEAGTVIEQRATTSRKGTSITVEQLFYNTPARLKFMSSLQTETAKIADLMQRLALSHPTIAFTLRVEGNQLLKTVGNGQLQQTIAGIYSPSVAKQLLPFQFENLRFKVDGFTSLPELTRAKKQFISIFLNGRYIRNFMLVNAVIDGYRSKLMVNRFPITVLNITVDHRLVDVNAHPTKETVRISQEQELVALITQAIDTALTQVARIPSQLPNRFNLLQTTSETVSDTNHDNDDVHQNGSHTKPLEKGQQSTLNFNERHLPTHNDQEANTVTQLEQNTPHETNLAYETTLLTQQIDEWSLPFNEPSVNAHRTTEEQVDTTVTNHFPTLYYFGQMHGTYLFAENENGLYIVDQHAAQERIKYEHYRVEIGKVNTAQQQLLIPIVLEFSMSEQLLIQEKLSLLEEVGVYLEAFGQSSFLLSSHPTWIKEDVESVVRDLVQMVLDDHKIDLAKYRQKLAIMMSCKQSIKANFYLDAKQANALLHDLSRCENPYNCPHGRPILVHLSTNDIEKMFKRIQDSR